MKKNGITSTNQKEILMKVLQIVTVFLSFSLLSSCMMANKGQMGAAGGAAGGAIIGQAIGNDTGSTVLGAAIGGMLGYVLGNEMDKYDRQMLNSAYESTPSGQTSTWVNPDHGNKYQVTPQQAYTGPQNQQCRKAEILAVIDGRTETTYTTACRDINGQWKLQ
jgi:surface antigen